MTDNPSSSPQISQTPSPSHSPNPAMLTSSSPSTSRSMPRLTALQQQQLTAAISARQFGGGGGAQVSFGQGVGRVGQQIPMLPEQSMAQFNNMQAQLLLQQTRPKTGLGQGMQFNSGNSSAQGLQGMQALGMMNSLGINQQLRANGPLSYGQRYNNGQMRQHQQQQISMQNSLTSPQKIPGQSLPRGSTLAAMNPHFSGLTQNGQSTSVQNALAQQPWLKQMQQAVSSAGSPSHHLQQQQRQQQAFSQQQPTSSQLQHQKSMGLTQQQLAQLLQNQGQLGSPRQQQQLLQQQQQLQMQQLQMFQQLQQQQQSPRMQGSGLQRSVSLTGSQPGTPASVTTNTCGNSSQGADASNQLLGKRKIQDLVSQVDPHARLDPEVEDLLLEIADNFIESATTFACSLAKHRKSSILESKDLLLHLEKNQHLTIPGFTKEGHKSQKEPLLLEDMHSKRLESTRIRAAMECQPYERDATQSTGRQGMTDSSPNHPLKPSLSSELILSASASQMLQKAPQF